jgi:hypothetical protein
LFQIVEANMPGYKYQENFPRNLQEIAICGLEIPVQYQSPLTLSTARRYICILDRAKPKETGEDRQLYGFLHVGPPSNLILIEETLPPDVRNYVLAHELGHFLADVITIQQRWLKSLPEHKDMIVQAFNWQHTDPWLELCALIKGLPARPKTITARGAATTGETYEREILADLIARELLAPWDMAISLHQRHTPATFFVALQHTFGLPEDIAHYYQDEVRRYLEPQASVLNRLFAPMLQYQQSKNQSEN